MGEAEDRLVLALMEANERMTLMGVELKEDQAELNSVLHELAEEGVIDLDRLVEQHKANKAQISDGLGCE